MKSINKESQKEITTHRHNAIQDKTQTERKTDMHTARTNINKERQEPWHKTRMTYIRKTDRNKHTDRKNRQEGLEEAMNEGTTKDNTDRQK